MEDCYGCGFLNEYGCCDCSHADKWYACPVENKKPKNIQALKEYTEWLPQYEGKWVVESEAKSNDHNKI